MAAAVHLLKSKPGKCLACGAVYGDVVTGKTPGQVGVDDKGQPVMGEVDVTEHRHPGSFFDNPAAWSLHQERCDRTRVASGTIDAVVWADASRPVA